MGKLREIYEFVTGSYTADLAEAEKRLRKRKGPPAKGTLEPVVDGLNQLLSRLLDSKHQLDTKAALIIPAIAAIAGLVVDRVPAHPTGIAIVWGAGAVLFGVFGVLYAIGAIWAADHKIGPGAEQMALGTSHPDSDGVSQAIADGLALAIIDTRRMILTKGSRVNRSLLCAAAGVILLLLFVASGGLAVTNEGQQQGGETITTNIVDGGGGSGDSSGSGDTSTGPGEQGQQAYEYPNFSTTDSKAGLPPGSSKIESRE